MATFDDAAALERFAAVAVDFAANVQPGQVVKVVAEIGHTPLTRALARRAYQAGASYVDVAYFDMHVKHARIAHAREDTLDYVPPYLGQEVLALGDLRSAMIGLTGPTYPGLMDDLDPERAGRDQLPSVKELGTVVDDRTVNWAVLPGPTRAWAQAVHRELDPEAAWQRLCDQLVHICRLDADDPPAAWRERMQTLAAVASQLDERRIDALRFRGPGTDLTVGLLPASRWKTVVMSTVDGIAHFANLPSEEVYTTPDPLRADGVVRATKPLILNGITISGLEVEFSGGRAVRIDADRGADVLRGFAARDEGAARLGEVALVDGDGRVGQHDVTFMDTLLDENAASHIALGHGYADAVDESHRSRINESEIHVDFMIGGPDVEVLAQTATGETPLLRAGRWLV